MMSGRGLAHTTRHAGQAGGVPRVPHRADAWTSSRSVLGRVGCAMMGQTRGDRAAGPAPLRTPGCHRPPCRSLPLIAASIMSKKLAEDLTGLVLDVKVGSAAFIPEEERALSLASAMVGIGHARGLPAVALLTAMDRPLRAEAVGNALETAEAVACLRSEGPADLRELVLVEASEMLLAGFPGLARAEARARAEAALSSGRALERLARLVEAQGGDPSIMDEPRRFATAPERVGGRWPGRPGRCSAWIRSRSGRRWSRWEVGAGAWVRPSTWVSASSWPSLRATGWRRAIPGHRARARRGPAWRWVEAALRSAIRVGDGVAALRPLVSHRVSTGG
ncbi:MAG: hypothetical protein MZU95_03705 [Desulfomicrobium escambiense]|nr:hypothetical protein [Desulfomicrobium escambiense]